MKYKKNRNQEKVSLLMFLVLTALVCSRCKPKEKAPELTKASATSGKQGSCCSKTPSRFQLNLPNLKNKNVADTLDHTNKASHGKK